MPRKIEPPRIKQAGNGYFYVHFWNPDFRRTERESLETKEPLEAERRFGLWLTDRHAESEATSVELTVAEYIGFYEAEHCPDVADSERQGYALTPIKKFFGPKRPREITPASVNAYRLSRKHPQTNCPIADGTVIRELTALIAALNWGKEHHGLGEVPTIVKPPAPEACDRWLDDSEVELLLATAEGMRRKKDQLGRVELFCWIALEAAARRKSIERLSWPQVNLKHKLIDFRTPGKRQTKKKQVPVPMSDELHAILERAYKERKNDLWVLGNPGSIKTSFNTLIEKSGLEDVHPHVLRHTAATRMAQAGVPLAVIAQILGNSVAMVEKVYAKWQSEALRQGVNWRKRA